MNKKVLDGAVTLLFCMSLIVTSSIQEKDTGEPQRELERNTTVTAGAAFFPGIHLRQNQMKRQLLKRERLSASRRRRKCCRPR